MEKIYRQQVSLLLSVLPAVAKEKCFALHGGTAINLFVRDMPRLSVDIDLTYLPIEDRITSIFISMLRTRIPGMPLPLHKLRPGIQGVVEFHANDQLLLIILVIIGKSCGDRP